MTIIKSRDRRNLCVAIICPTSTNGILVNEYTAMSASRNSTADSPAPPDFSVPWKCSDVVLVVERQKFHVHRYTLAMWSPVFEKMFTSEFKEKNSCEIPLPNKKASEIKELLLIIYPTISGKAWKTVTDENCYFLLELADEYQMEDIRNRCEDVLVDLVSRKLGNSCLAVLPFAQYYKLEKLLGTIVNKARQLTLSDFKSHEMYDKMDPAVYKQIVEGIIERLEKNSGNNKRNYYR